MTGDTGTSTNTVQEQNLPVVPENVNRPLAKLMIGAFAGLCACFFPRLLLLINVADQSSPRPDIFEFEYILCTLIFSTFVGVVVMLLEWNVGNKPGKTFLMALSVPALIAGGVNTNNAYDLFASNAAVTVELSKKLQDSLAIETDDKPSNIKNIPFPEQKDSSFLLRLGGRDAQAEENSVKSPRFFALRVKEELFMILLDTSATKGGAFENAQRIREKYNLRDIRVIEYGENKFGVVYTQAKLSRPEALLVIYDLKKKFSDLNPSLLPVPD
jgi:hypothetical protein